MKKINSLLPASLAAFVLIAGLVSCNIGIIQQPTSPPPIARPEYVTCAGEVGPMQVALFWDAVEGATGYRVSYGKTADYGSTVETTEPSVVITGLEKDTTYYFAVRTKNGKVVSSLPKDIVIATDAPDTPSEQADTDGSGQWDDNDPITPPAQNPVQEIPEMQLFDIAVFNTHRATWDAEHPSEYGFNFKHHGPPGMFLSGGTHFVKDELPVLSGPIVWTGNEESRPLLLFSTVSELYEKVATVWAEQSDIGDAFLIKYNEKHHYISVIQIKNFKDSGYDYTVNFWGLFPDDSIDY